MDELWDSMCHTAITLISKALDEVDNAEVLLKIKGVIALFIQTMDVSEFLHVSECSQLTYHFEGLGILGLYPRQLLTETL